MDYSLVLFKPDTIYAEHGCRTVGFLLDHLMREYELVEMKLTRMDADFCKLHYHEHVGKDFYPGLEEFMTSGPLVAAVFKGPVESIRNEVLDLRKTCHPKYKNPMNLLHASDSEAAAEYEIDLWFPASDAIDNAWIKCAAEKRAEDQREASG